MYKLPPQMKAKKDDRRSKRFRQEHGDDVFELEALEPADLQGILRNSILSRLEIDLYNKEVAAEQDDSQKIAEVKTNLSGLMGGLTL